MTRKHHTAHAVAHGALMGVANYRAFDKGAVNRRILFGALPPWAPSPTSAHVLSWPLISDGKR